jgi:hypothetical protein
MGTVLGQWLRARRVAITYEKEDEGIVGEEAHRRIVCEHGNDDLGKHVGALGSTGSDTDRSERWHTETERAVNMQRTCSERDILPTGQ